MKDIMILVLSHPKWEKLVQDAEVAKFLTTVPYPKSKTPAIWRIEVSGTYEIGESDKELLDSLGVNYGVFPDMRFGDLDMIASDMDSTFITIECIDEVAALLGIKDKVAAITESSMRGEIDFHESLTRRVGLLKGIEFSSLQKVYDDALRITKGVPSVVKECHAQDVKFLLVSGGFTFFTDRLKERYKLDFALANVFDVDSKGRLSGKIKGGIIDSKAKVDEIDRLVKENGMSLEKVLAIGDGANDIPMIRHCGIGVAFHGKPKTRRAAQCVINTGGMDALFDFFA